MLLTHFPIAFEPKEFEDDYIQVEEIEQFGFDKSMYCFVKKISLEEEKSSRRKSIRRTSGIENGTARHSQRDRP